MGEAMIVRRGGFGSGGGGFSPNDAVLKVITSTGCTVTVSGTGYSKTQQDGDGFPRSDDANVTEHFFSIPASAFGTITVKATNTYGDNTKTVSVNTAGRVYEVLCGGKNIIFNSTFGLQSGYTLNSDYWEYQDRFNRIYNISTSDYHSVFSDIEGEPPIPVSAYRTLSMKQYSGAARLEDIAYYELCELTFSGEEEKTGNITNIVHPTARLLSSGVYIYEIILS